MSASTWAKAHLYAGGCAVALEAGKISLLVFVTVLRDALPHHYQGRLTLQRRRVDGCGRASRTLLPGLLQIDLVFHICRYYANQPDDDCANRNWVCLDRLLVSRRDRCLPSSLGAACAAYWSIMARQERHC